MRERGLFCGSSFCLLLNWLYLQINWTWTLSKCWSVWGSRLLVNFWFGNIQVTINAINNNGHYQGFFIANWTGQQFIGQYVLILTTASWTMVKLRDFVDFLEVYMANQLAGNYQWSELIVDQLDCSEIICEIKKEKKDLFLPYFRSHVIVSFESLYIYNINGIISGLVWCLYR